MPHQLEIIRLPGLTPYRQGYAAQIARRDLVERGEAPNTLFLLEHAPVITLGRDWHAEHLLEPRDTLEQQGITVTETDRGGDVTYHGPGQLVAYPILNLNEWRCSVGWYLRSVEEVIIRMLAVWGLEGTREAGRTGVWVGNGKVAAVGVGIHHWVTCHGAALNLAPDPAHFAKIIPCGIADKPVVSLRELLGAAPSFDTAAALFAEEFLRVFDCVRAAPEPRG